MPFLLSSRAFWMYKNIERCRGQFVTDTGIAFNVMDNIFLVFPYIHICVCLNLYLDVDVYVYFVYQF